MLKYFRPKKICNCTNPIDKEILKREINHSFCKRCGSIILNSNDGKINFTLKPKQKQAPNETSPFEIIRSMKENTEKNCPYLNNTEESFKSKAVYLLNRKMILYHLQKLMKTFDYNDIVFYQCLFFMDYVFSQKVNHELSEKEIMYYLIGYFLCSTKMKETDASEPPLEYFVKIKQNTFFSIKQIAQYEVACLKSINYNIFSYSAYDWVMQLISIGIVFDCEIDSKNSIIILNGHRHTIINSINKYILKMLLNLTLKNIFLKYSPAQIAFSLIQIAREKFLDPNLINNNLYNKLINFYYINFDEFQNCYEELKLEINQEVVQKEKDENEEKNNENNNNNENIKSKIIKKYFIENNFIGNIYKMKKNVILNKSSSCKVLLNSFKNINEKEIAENNKEINEKNIKDKLNEKTSIEKEKISGGKNDKMTINTELNKIPLKKQNKYSTNYEKKSGRSNDNLPLINTKIQANIEPVKESIEIKSKSSKSVLDVFDNCNRKLITSKKNYVNRHLSSVQNNVLNYTKMKKTINKFSSINRTNVFKFKQNESIQNGNNDKKVVYKIRKSSKILPFYNNFEDIKINNNNETIDKTIDINTLKSRVNFRHKFSTKGNLFSVPNKRNQSIDFIPEIKSRVLLI